MSESCDLACPRCGSSMHPVSREGRLLHYACDRAEETGCKGRWFLDRTMQEEIPFLVKCPECGQGLRREYSRNTGRLFCACFEREEHASGDTLFVNLDGTPRERLKAKGYFHCPVCGGELLYHKVQTGPHRGETLFSCYNRLGHEDGKNLHFKDMDGRPLLRRGEDAA